MWTLAYVVEQVSTLIYILDPLTPKGEEGLKYIYNFKK